MKARFGYGVSCGLIVGLLTVSGCSDKPKPMPQPTPAQTRADSDRFFDKMKQDEREQGKNVTPGR